MTALPELNGSLVYNSELGECRVRAAWVSDDNEVYFLVVVARTYRFRILSSARFSAA